MITSSPNPGGNSLQPSVQAVAAHSTPIDKTFSEDSAKALLAIILGLSAELLSPDAQFLALIRAKKNAQAMGVSPQEFDRVALVAAKHMEAVRKSNPMSCLF